MNPCEPCKPVLPCLQFPLVFYSLSDHKSYSNQLLSFPITCPDDSVQTVYVPAGTINYTLPFAPGFAGPYPPLVLGCVSGGNVVRAVPDFATQEQIDVLVDEMINICARAYAESIVVCPGQVFTNEQVIFQMPCAVGEMITYSGTLPSWLTLNTATNQVIGQAGVINGTSTAEATATAQAQLNAWAEAAITATTLTCEPATNICSDGLGALINNIYGIVGYVDGMIVNTSANPTGNPLWDGTFAFATLSLPLRGWASGELETLTMDGNQGFCVHTLRYNCSGDDITWRLSFDSDAGLWTGEKAGGSTPEGVYTRISGVDPGPATVTIELLPGVTTVHSGNVSCST